MSSKRESGLYAYQWEILKSQDKFKDLPRGFQSSLLAALECTIEGHESISTDDIIARMDKYMTMDGDTRERERVALLRKMA